MSRYTTRNFRGIAPRDLSASLGPDTNAAIAKNVDLSRGVCRPAKADEVLYTGHSGPSFSAFGDQIISGIDNPVSMFSRSKETLIYRKLGSWRKKVGNQDVPLGVKSPGQPTLQDISFPTPDEPLVQVVTINPTGEYLVRGEYAYHVCWAREEDGTFLESKSVVVAPDPMTKETDPRVFHRIFRPNNTPPRATHWCIYRSDNGLAPKLVATCSVYNSGHGFDHFDDTKKYAGLTRSIGEYSNDTSENYGFAYVITFEREVDGKFDESGPSLPTRIEQNNIGVKITRPLSVPSGVTGWNIYRVSEDLDPTTDFELVDRVPIGTSAYEDYKINKYLGDVIPTSFASSDGFTVNAETPNETITGINGPHNGMLFGWAGGTIYYSEPGEVDYWSEFYKLEAKGEVVSCIPIGVGVIAITKQGVQMISGNQPLAMTISETISGYGGISHRLTAYGKEGAFFLSHAGLIAVDSSGATRNITERTLGDEYFKGYDFDSAMLEVHNERIFLSNAALTIVFDLGSGTITTKDPVYTDLQADRPNGRLLGLSSNGAIVDVEGSDMSLSARYQTSDIVLGNPQDKRFMQFEFFGEGEINVKVFINNSEVAGRTLNMDQMRRHRRIKVPRANQGRSARIEWEGYGVVQELQTEVELAPIEVKTA